MVSRWLQGTVHGRGGAGSGGAGSGGAGRGARARRPGGTGAARTGMRERPGTIRSRSSVQMNATGIRRANWSGKDAARARSLRTLNVRVKIRGVTGVPDRVCALPGGSAFSQDEDLDDTVRIGRRRTRGRVGGWERRRGDGPALGDARSGGDARSRDASQTSEGGRSRWWPVAHPGRRGDETNATDERHDLQRRWAQPRSMTTTHLRPTEPDPDDPRGRDGGMPASGA